VSFPGVKRPGRGVDHPPQSSAEVKERVELYLCSPFWAFVACSKVNFTFTSLHSYVFRKHIKHNLDVYVLYLLHIHSFHIIRTRGGQSSRYRDQTRGWTIRGSNPGRRKRVSLLQNVKTGFETHEFSYSMCAGVLSREYNGWGVTLNINLRLESRLRMSGAVLVLPLCLHGVGGDNFTCKFFGSWLSGISVISNRNIPSCGARNNRLRRHMEVRSGIDKATADPAALGRTPAYTILKGICCWFLRTEFRSSDRRQ
jgi:hypothetical protein